MIPLSSPAIDLDKNGVSDVWQKAYPGTILTGEVDSDGDGLSDLKEGYACTDPFDSRNNLKATLAPNASEYQLTWESQPWMHYQVQQSTNLVTWADAGHQIESTQETFYPRLSIDLSAPSTPVFWRILAKMNLGDTDDDGLNAWEESALGTDPQKADTDGDGIPDGKDFAYSAGPTTFSPPGAGVVNGNLIRYNTAGEAVKLRAFGVNYFNAFERYTSVSTDTAITEKFTFLSENNIPVARVIFAGLYPKSWSLFFEDRNEFWRRSDAFVAMAERKKVGILLCLFFHCPAAGELVQKAVNANYLVPITDFTPRAWIDGVDRVDGNATLRYAEYRGDIGREGSGTDILIQKITKEVVARYKDSPAIWGWEFSNETNLKVDLPYASMTLGQIEEAKVKRPSFNGFVLPIDDTLRHEAISRDNLMHAKKRFADAVRSVDPWRFISMGDAVSRAAAHNLWKDPSDATPWTPTDTRTELKEIMGTDNPGTGIAASVHVYPVKNSTIYFKDDGTIELFAENPPFTQFFSALKTAAQANGNPLIVGEWNAPGDGKDLGGSHPDERRLFHAMAQALVDTEVQLSLLWNFDHATKDDKQTKLWPVNVDGPKIYQVFNNDPALWDLRQLNQQYGRW
jgi:hypothetical protein